MSAYFATWGVDMAKLMKAPASSLSAELAGMAQLQPPLGEACLLPQNFGAGMRTRSSLRPALWSRHIQLPTHTRAAVLSPKKRLSPPLCGTIHFLFFQSCRVVRILTAAGELTVPSAFQVLRLIRSAPQDCRKGEKP